MENPYKRRVDFSEGEKQIDARAQITALIPKWKQYYHHPVEFVEELIFKDTGLTLTNQQKELLKAIAENLRVSCKAGTGIGKTSALSCAIQWFLCTREKPLIPCTAPTMAQLRDVLWTEIARWLNVSRLRQFISWRAESIHLIGDPETSKAVARTAKDPQSMAGLHAPNMLFIVDEASVIRRELMEVIENTTTQEENRWVMIGNPTQIAGFFYDSHHEGSDDWKRLTFNAEESPIVKPEHIARIARRYGKDSDLYRVRVLGEFPRGNPEAFIQLADLELAMTREIDVVPKAPFELGVDVARYGNNLTAICPRQGNKAFTIITKSKSSILETVRLVFETVIEYRKICQYNGIVRVKIDDTGLGGGVTDILKEDRDHNIMAIPCTYGIGGMDDHASAEYFDKASMMWGEFRDQLPYLELPQDGFLREELSTRKFKVTGGRIRLQSKDEFKTEYGDSPDRADAVILAFAKSTEKKRILSFSKYNEKHQRDFKINWKLLTKRNAQVYMTIWQDDDLVTSLIPCLWDGFDGHLWIFDEVISQNPRPESIIPRIHLKMTGHLKGQIVEKISVNKYQWWCNKEMCGITGTTKNAMQTAKDGIDMMYSPAPYNIGLNPNLNLDLYGSISILSSMFARGMVTVHSRCDETIRQLTDWAIEKNGRPGESNIGCCMAICNIVSLLHEWGHSRKFLPKLLPYSPQSEAARQFIEKADREGKLFDYADRLLVPGQRKV